MKNKKQNEELQNRREFFKSSAKKALPIIGGLVLLGKPFIASATRQEVMNCNSACSYSCSGCQGDCYGTCRNGCRGECRGGCGGGCKGTCLGTCQGGCYGHCKSSSKY